MNTTKEINMMDHDVRYAYSHAITNRANRIKATEYDNNGRYAYSHAIQTEKIE